MKILQIIDSLMMGGAQKLLTVFVDEMLRHGHKVEVVTLMNYEMDQAIFDDLEKLGVTAKCFPLKNLMDIPTLLNLNRFIKSSKPDIVHTQLNYANIIGTWSAHKSAIPCVSSLHNASIHLFKERRYRTWLETWILNSYSRRIIACGYTVAGVQQSRFKSMTLIVIPNPVPVLRTVTISEILDFRNSQFSDGNGVLLVAVGRLILEKGYPDMLQAISQIQKQTNTEFKLVIVGGGPLLGELLEIVKDLGLDNYVSFVGQRNDVSTILAASDIFISTSLFEGQSIAVLEAMAAGLPVIVTEVGDNKDVISPDCGILVPKGQPRQMAEKTLWLMENQIEREKLGRNAAQKVKKDHSATLWVDQLLALYQEVIDE